MTVSPSGLVFSDPDGFKGTHRVCCRATLSCDSFDVFSWVAGAVVLERTAPSSFIACCQGCTLGLVTVRLVLGKAVLFSLRSHTVLFGSVPCVTHSPLVRRGSVSLLLEGGRAP